MLYKKGEMSMLHSKSVVTVPPGATIREQLDTRGMNQKEFAKRMGMTEKHISHLINGKVELTQEVALRLESVLGLPASFWNNLESLYREKIARIRAEREMERDEIIARQIPYSKIAKLGWVPATKNIGEKVIHLRAFFEVAQLNLLCNLQVPGIAYRKMGENATSDYALAVWAQKARLEARSVEVSPICISALKESIAAIRALTIESPEVFCIKLRELLSDCGFAIVFLPHIGGSFLHGASFMDGNHIVVGVTVRGKDADRFWFAFFMNYSTSLKGTSLSQAAPM
jgi:HTH-type transcriptional regulator/antitoxin HigA